MILKWGAYAHQNNEVWFDLSRRAIFSPAGKRFKIREIWTIQGVLRGTSQADLTTKTAALETAYASDGNKDLIFYLDDGTTETTHKRLASSTINGLRVTQPVSWTAGASGLWGAGIEYQRVRSFRVVVECEYLDLESSLLAYFESVTYQPTGSEFVIQETLTGSPEKYTTQASIRIVGKQQGYAIGATSYPSVATSLYPSDTRARLSYTGKKLSGDFGLNQSTKFVSFWKYHFESVSALSSNPATPSF